MLQFQPPLTDQQVLAYFSRPGRDLNHKLISEMLKRRRFSNISPASASTVEAFMCLALSQHHSPHLRFLSQNTADPVETTLHLNWWPVGQGLFSTGILHCQTSHAINWVYDCGTSSSKELIDTCIEVFNDLRRLHTCERLDLAVLSHFDHDHISGFCDLVQKTPIGTILLPYLTLLQRIILAIQQDIPGDSPILDFYLNPVAFLSNLDGADVEGFVFVLPSGPEDETGIEPIEPEPDPDSTKASGSFLKVDAQRATSPEETLDDNYTAIGAPIRYLRKGGRLMVPGRWEFVPYNDREMLPEVSNGFQTIARSLAHELVSRPENRKETLATLKALYDGQFGKGSYPRNIISLFLYSGPINGNPSLTHVMTSHRTGFEPGSQRFAQLYTGDGSLATSAQYDRLTQFYSHNGRFHRAGIVQVMHHGAQSNWHASVATKLNPEVSIFSSYPMHRRYQHPHDCVLRDFWQHFPVQVDRSEGFEFIATY